MQRFRCSPSLSFVVSIIIYCRETRKLKSTREDFYFCKISEFTKIQSESSTLKFKVISIVKRSTSKGSSNFLVKRQFTINPCEDLLSPRRIHQKRQPRRVYSRVTSRSNPSSRHRINLDIKPIKPIDISPCM